MLVFFEQTCDTSTGLSKFWDDNKINEYEYTYEQEHKHEDEYNINMNTNTNDTSTNANPSMEMTTGTKANMNANTTGALPKGYSRDDEYTVGLCNRNLL